MRWLKLEGDLTKYPFQRNSDKGDTEIIVACIHGFVREATMVLISNGEGGAESDSKTVSHLTEPRYLANY